MQHLADTAAGQDLFISQAETGRAAVAQCLEAAAEHHGLDGPAELERHKHFVQRPDIKVSLAHTKDLGVVLTNAAPEVLAVGCDAEWADRSMRPGIERHFMNAEDDAAARTDLLRSWVRKEAAFKAADPHRERWSRQTLLLSRLWLRAGEFGLVGAREAVGRVWVQALDLGGQQLLLGLACIKFTDSPPLDI